MYNHLKIARNSCIGEQWFRRIVGCEPGLKLFHSSSVALEPAAVAPRNTAVASPDLEDVEALRLMRNSFAPSSRANLLPIEDVRALYNGVTSKELLASLFNLQLVSFDPLVNLSLKVFASPLMKLRLTSVPILWLVKRTAYSHFCAGEDTTEAGHTLTRLYKLGLKGVLDYSLEDAEDNKTCDENYAGFVKTIQSTSLLPPGSVSFACFKISAIYPVSLLERMSDDLRWQIKNPDYKISWNESDVQVLALDSPTYHTRRTPEPWSREEQKDLARAEKRWNLLCKACEDLDLPILIDAEYTSIQPAIDYITSTAGFEFNTCSRTIVFGTLQAYLKDAPSRLSVSIQQASKRNVPLAMKLVRGAYITRENMIAASLGVPSPVHRSIEDTHYCYNFCAATMLDRVASGSSSVMLATHNLESGKFAAQRAVELGLEKAGPRLQFAQLKGMSDYLSLALVQAGFNVSKYLAFGPVAHVIPYLVRRAEENRGLLGNTLADRQRLRKELERRLLGGASVHQL